MAEGGAREAIEVSLFTGPRAAWDIGSQVLTSGGKHIGARCRGMDQVVYALEDIQRACRL